MDGILGEEIEDRSIVRYIGGVSKVKAILPSVPVHIFVDLPDPTGITIMPSSRSIGKQIVLYCIHSFLIQAMDDQFENEKEYWYCGWRLSWSSGVAGKVGYPNTIRIIQIVDSPVRFHYMLKAVCFNVEFWPKRCWRRRQRLSQRAFWHLARASNTMRLMIKSG